MAHVRRSSNWTGACSTAVRRTFIVAHRGMLDVAKYLSQIVADLANMFQPPEAPSKRQEPPFEPVDKLQRRVKHPLRLLVEMDQQLFVGILQSGVKLPYAVLQAGDEWRPRSDAGSEDRESSA